MAAPTTTLADRYLEALFCPSEESAARKTIDGAVNNLLSFGLEAGETHARLHDWLADRAPGPIFLPLVGHLDQAEAVAPRTPPEPMGEPALTATAAPSAPPTAPPLAVDAVTKGGVVEPPASVSIPEPPQDLGEWAAALARRGFRVFPLVLGTKIPPKGFRWKEAATSDLATVNAWGSGIYRNHNIGVALNADQLVLDCDTKHGKPGLASLDMLDAEGLPRGMRVRTPSGGMHVYLTLPAGVAVANSVDAIPDCPGVDVRSLGGYVVGPGSSIDGAAYEDLGGEPEPAPQWLIDLLPKAGRKAAAKSREPLTELDTDDAITRAVDYLQHTAPEAIEGAGGDQTTYEVACRVRDFGVSEHATFDLMAEHWNEAKASPPWPLEDLERKVANAFAYGQNAPGKMSGLLEFGDVRGELAPPESATNVRPNWVMPFDPITLPRRRWVLDRFLAKRYLTALVAPPGAGKTTLEIQIAVALATGRPEIAGFKTCTRERVYLWNQEDDLEELQRRLAAAMKAFDVSWDDLTLDGKPMLSLDSGVDRPLMIATRDQAGRIVDSGEQAALIETVKEHSFGVVIVEPFVELHPAEENNNVEVAAAARSFRSLAVKGDCAVLLSHHPRKPPTADSSGHVGNMDSARGASALMGVARIGATLYTIDDKTGKGYGVAEEDQRRYLRLDDSKGNMSFNADGPAFYRREGCNIRTFEDPEEVGVLRPVELTKRLSQKERAAESHDELFEALRVVMAGRNSMKFQDCARAMAENPDSLYFGDKADTLVKRIERAFKREKPDDLALTSAGGGRPRVLSWTVGHGE